VSPAGTAGDYNYIQTGGGLTSAEMAQQILNDPVYLYEKDRFAQQQALEAAHRAQDLQLSLASARAAGSYSTPDYSKLLDLSRQQTAEQKAEATRKSGLQQEYNWERLASMGQATSGTPLVESQNMASELQHLLTMADLGQAETEERINIQRQQASAAAAAARRSASIQAQAAQTNYNQWLEVQAFNAQGQEYEMLLSSGQRVAARWWDPSTGLYRGPNGVTMTVGEVNTLLAGAIPPPAAG